MRHPVSSLDVQVLQTAASLENLAVTSYRAAARLPAVSRGGPALAAFVSRTGAQHSAHADAFNAAVMKLGGKAQHAPDPRYAAAARRGLAAPGGAAGAVSVLESLEDLKAQSYTRYATLISPALRTLFVGVAAVEAEHRSFLLAVLKLLEAGAEQLIRIPSVAAELPRVVGDACVPQTFYPTAGASAVDEGKVR